MIRTLLLVLSNLPGAAKNLLLFRRLQRDPDAAAIWDAYFDPNQYLNRYADVAVADVDPARHFLIRGNQELRDPSNRFSSTYYLSRYPDLAGSNVNALLHYALFGRREGRAIRSSMSPYRGENDEGLHQDKPVPLVNNQWPPDSPLVSIVIPCFNYGRYVEAALRSAVGQTFTDLEVIVVEGGSDDGTTPDAIRRLETLGFPNVRFYYRSGRHLAGDNRNFGIGVARGRYICCLDADDILLPSYIEVAVFLAETQGYDLVSSSVQCFGDSNILWPLLSDPSFPEIMEANTVSTAALFRRSAWAQVGGFRDWALGADHVCEDWDFWIRLLGHGARGKNIAEPLLSYRTHTASVTATSKPSLAVQRLRLEEANLTLKDTYQQAPARCSVIDPEINLASRLETPGILFALPFITVGGAEKLFHSIAGAAAAQGVNVVIITSQTLAEVIPEDSRKFESITPRIFHLSRMFDSDDIRTRFLLYLIRRYNVCTLMIAGCEFTYQLLPDIKREFPSIRVVDQLFNGVVHVANNHRYNNAIDATVVPSEVLRRQLMNDHGAAPDSVQVIPHGIHIPNETEPLDVSPIPALDGRIVIGYFGRLSSEKGPDLFVEIVRKLARDKRLGFIMTGEGPEIARVQALIRKYRLGERIHMPGFVADPLPLLRRADIVVLPSRIDGMPLVVLEAQALGKPVVASRIGSIPEMISHGVTGTLCEAENIKQFCSSILALAADPAMRASFGAAGRRAMIENFSSDRMLAGYMRIFGIQSSPVSATPCDHRKMVADAV